MFQGAIGTYNAPTQISTTTSAVIAQSYAAGNVQGVTAETVSTHALGNPIVVARDIMGSSNDLRGTACAPLGPLSPDTCVIGVAQEPRAVGPNRNATATSTTLIGGTASVRLTSNIRPSIGDVLMIDAPELQTRNTDMTARARFSVRIAKPEDMCDGRALMLKLGQLYATRPDAARATSAFRAFVADLRTLLELGHHGAMLVAWNPQDTGAQRLAPGPAAAPAFSENAIERVAAAILLNDLPTTPFGLRLRAVRQLIPDFFAASIMHSRGKQLGRTVSGVYREATSNDKNGFGLVAVQQA